MSTKLRVQAARRLSLRFRTRKPQSSGATETTCEVGSKSTISREEYDESGPKVGTKKQCTAITILNRNDDADDNMEKVNTVLAKKQPLEPLSRAENLAKRAEEESMQEALCVLQHILEKQQLNSTEVYSVSGRELRIEVLEDTEF